MEMVTIPQWYIVSVIFLLGAIVGSFLNVVIYRLHTGRSVSGRSHCLSCGQTLRWWELVPVFSYLGLRARCARCGSLITPRYLVVELLTAALFVSTYVVLHDLLPVIFGCLIAAVLVVLVVYDYNHFIIPDQLVVALLALAVLWQAYQWAILGRATDALLLDLFASISVTGFFALLWFVSRGRWLGFGDVKVVFPLSLLVGYGFSFSFVVLSFWIGAIVSLVLLLLARLCSGGKGSLRFFGQSLTMKSEVPFGPFLVAGFFATWLGHLDVLTIIFYAFY